MKLLKPNDILSFGKNKGFKLKDVYKYQPSYLEWAILNIYDFKIDIEEFKKLPNPTPFTYIKENFDDKIVKKELSLLKRLAIIDQTNTQIDLDTIIKLKQSDEFKFESINYEFPKRIVEINKNK